MSAFWEQYGSMVNLEVETVLQMYRDALDGKLKEDLGCKRIVGEFRNSLEKGDIQISGKALGIKEKRMEEGEAPSYSVPKLRFFGPDNDLTLNGKATTRKKTGGNSTLHIHHNKEKIVQIHNFHEKRAELFQQQADPFHQKHTQPCLLSEYSEFVPKETPSYQEETSQFLILKDSEKREKIQQRKEWTCPSVLQFIKLEVLDISFSFLWKDFLCHFFTLPPSSRPRKTIDISPTFAKGKHSQLIRINNPNIKIGPRCDLLHSSKPSLNTQYLRARRSLRDQHLCKIK